MFRYNQDQKIVYSPQLWLYNTGNEISKESIKYGTIENVRDDSYEKKCRKLDPQHIYYSIKFDDGTFDTYVNEAYIILANDFNVSLAK